MQEVSYFQYINDHKWKSRSKICQDNSKKVFKLIPQSSFLTPFNPKSPNKANFYPILALYSTDQKGYSILLSKTTVPLITT